MIITIHREMTITHDDFFRILPYALNEFAFEIHDNKVLCQAGSGQIEIELSLVKTKNLGALKLPVMHVKFVLDNVKDEIKNRFFEKFDLAFQKGGG